METSKFEIDLNDLSTDIGSIIMDVNKMDRESSSNMTRPREIVSSDSMPSLDMERIFTTTEEMNLYSVNSNLTNLSQGEVGYISSDSDDDSSEYGSDVHSLTPETGFNSPVPKKNIHKSNVQKIVAPPNSPSKAPATIPTQNPEFTWAFLNCPATLKMAGLLLFVGGLVMCTAGVAAASAAAVATAGAVIAGVGALLGLYGQFHKPEMLTEPENGVDNTLTNAVRT